MAETSCHLVMHRPPASGALASARATSVNSQFSVPIGDSELASSSETILQSTAIDGDYAEVDRYVRASSAESTRRAYSGDLADFIAWGGAIPCSPASLGAVKKLLLQVSMNSIASMHGRR